MTQYRLSGEGYIIRVADGAKIPPSEENPDWLAYQAWLANGGTPLPAVLPPDVIEARVADVWAERQAIETDPMYGISPMGTAVLSAGLAAGNEKAQAIAAWAAALHAEAWARENAVRAGEPLGDWETPLHKPFSISEIHAELTA